MASKPITPEQRAAFFGDGDLEEIKNTNVEDTGRSNQQDYPTITVTPPGAEETNDYEWKEGMVVCAQKVEQEDHLSNRNDLVMWDEA